MRHRVLGLNRLSIPSTALAAITLGPAAALLEAAEPASAAFAGPNRRIAFASERDGDIEIYSMNPDGTGVKAPTNNSAVDTQPAVSPDGRTIPVASNRDARPHAHPLLAMHRRKGFPCSKA